MKRSESMMSPEAVPSSIPCCNYYIESEHILQPQCLALLLSILIFSIASLFDRPAYTALLPRVVKGEDLVTVNVFINTTGIIGGFGIGSLLYILMMRGADFTLIYGVNVTVLLIS